MKQLITEYGVESFEIEIRRTFTNADAARDWEERVLCRLKVNQNSKWINKTTNKSRPPMTGANNPFAWPEVIEKVIKAKTGVPRPDQSIRMKENHPMKNDAIRKKMSATRKRKIASGEIAVNNKGKKRLEII
jgi:hypothetical protein